MGAYRSMDDMDCPLQAFQAILGGKHKVEIVYHLMGATLRFGELRRKMDQTPPKMLVQQLKGLEADGIVHRELYPEVPPRTEYSLTPFGESLAPAILALYRWSEALFIAEGREDQLCPPESVARIERMAEEVARRQALPRPSDGESKTTEED